MKFLALILFIFSNNLFAQCEFNKHHTLFIQLAGLIKENSFVVENKDQYKDLRSDIKLLRNKHHIPKGRYRYFKKYDELYNYFELKGLKLISINHFDSLKTFEGDKLCYRFGDIVYNKKEKFYLFEVSILVSRRVGTREFYTLQCKDSKMILIRLYGHGIG